MRGLLPRPSIRHLGDVRLNKGQKHSLFENISCGCHSGEVIGLIAGDAVGHQEVQRQKHALAQFMNVNFFKIHGGDVIAALTRPAFEEAQFSERIEQ